jgi:hypothetical protein
MNVRAQDTKAEECNDLVIREGFPALLLPGGQRPNIDSDECLPRHAIWACDTALTFADRDALIADCETVFTARARENDTNYSAGTTYFLPCQMKPRCELESLVLNIFNKHTAVLDPTTFKPQQSGAEWWTLVLDDNQNEAETRTKKVSCDNHDDETTDDDEEGNEVGWHFDADYGLEAQAPNLLLHPRVATVTYLTDYGAPTVVLNVKSPAPSDTDKKSLEQSVDRVWLSSPKIGKHMAFDGRLLHGAPATYFPPSHAAAAPPVEPHPKKIKLDSDSLSRKRVTLLVNIWLNHCPLDAEPLEDDVVEQLQSNRQSDVEQVQADETVTGFSWNDSTFNLDKAPECRTLSLNVSSANPAGEDEVVLCGRIVTITYGAAMEKLHSSAEVAASCRSHLLELVCGPGALSIQVGEECPSEEDGDRAEAEDDDDDDA